MSGIYVHPDVAARTVINEKGERVFPLAEEAKYNGGIHDYASMRKAREAEMEQRKAAKDSQPFSDKDRRELLGYLSRPDSSLTGLKEILGDQQTNSLIANLADILGKKSNQSSGNSSETVSGPDSGAE